MRLACVLVVFAGLAAPAAGQPAPDKPLIVGVHDLPPHMIKNADGSWSGIGVEMWKRVAGDLHLRYEMREYSLEQLDKPRGTDIDVVIGIASTKASEDDLDLTAPYMSSGQAIAVRLEPRGALRALADTIVTWSVLRGIALFVLASFALGTIVWRLERHHNPDEYGGSVLRSVSGGALWTIEALFGTNKSLSRRPAARVFAVLWAAISVMLLALLTAKFSSELTVDQLTTSVSGPSDLPKVKVGAVSPSPGATYLERRGITFRSYADTSGLVDGLARGEIHAAVASAVTLRYQVAHNHPDDLTVLPATLHNTGVCFGLKLGSPLRKAISLASLSIVDSPEWQHVVASYLGGDGTL